MQNRSRYLLAAMLLALAACGQPANNSDNGDTVAAGENTPASGPVNPVQKSKGSIAFMQCAACHAVTAESAGKIGPNLANIFNQSAGQVDGYAYSEALAASQIVWDRPTLSSFLADPSNVLPGTKMVFVGIGNEAERAAIIDYLEDLPQAEQ